MKLKDMPIEELELLSYTDITYKILIENQKSMTTAKLFREICKLLELSDNDFDSKIGDYYTSLTLDKRFVLLKNNEWDVRDNHSVEIIIDDEDEDEEEEEVEESEEETDESEETEENMLDDDTLDDDLDDDMDDLSIIDEEEVEE